MLLVGASLTLMSMSADAFQSLGGKPSASLSRMLYVWDGNIPGDVPETQRLLRYASRQGFNTIALEASSVGYGVDGAADRYGEFIQEAHSSGFSVNALIGYAWFSVPDEAGLPGQPTGHGEGWSVVEGIACSNLFDGIVDDSQPAQVLYWDDEGAPHEWFWEDRG